MSGPQCTERGWYKDPSGNWRFYSPSKVGTLIPAGMGAHTLGIYGSDGVVYWICDQCRQAPPATPCNQWPGLYRRPADIVAAQFWDSYYILNDQNGAPPPAKIKFHGHDGDPATFQAHFPVGTQAYTLHTIDEIIPTGTRDAFIRAYGCDSGGGGGSLPTYCPDDKVRRGEIAVFLLKTKYGATYLPPPATGTMFSDVPITHQFAAWIEQLAREGITAGKSPCAP